MYTHTPILLNLALNIIIIAHAILPRALLSLHIHIRKPGLMT